jgi:predicted small integral membrane protein
MKHPAAAPDSLPHSASDGAPAALLSEARALWQELIALAQAQLQLAALETRRAGRSLITLVVAVLVLGAWLGLLAAGIVWLIEQGLPLSSALLLGVSINLLAALIVYLIIRRQRRYLQFPATRGSLRTLSARLKAAP